MPPTSATDAPPPIANNPDVRFLGALETPVKDGDTVTVLPAVAGGAR